MWFKQHGGKLVAWIVYNRLSVTNLEHSGAYFRLQSKIIQRKRAAIDANQAASMSLNQRIPTEILVSEMLKLSQQFRQKGDLVMIKLKKSLVLVITVLTLAAAADFIAMDIAQACGWGQSGGGDYVPQRRDSGSLWASKGAVSESQAREIVTNYVKRLNPDLELGEVKDNGGFYEIEIVNQGREVVQMLGVDKRSGRLILLN